MIDEVWDDGARGQYVRAFHRYESYIPFRPGDLCHLLINEIAEQCVQVPDDEGLQVLFEIHRRLGSGMKLRVADRFDEWQDVYALLDPDVDVILHPSEINNRENISKRNEEFQKRLAKALQEGSFEKLTAVDLEEASNIRSIWGFHVSPPNRSEIKTVMFARGRRIKTIEIADWKSLWLVKKEHELKTYQRVLMLFQKEAETDRSFLCGFLFNFIPRPLDSLSKSVKYGKMYLKMFKDIEMSDIDMLIPGSKVQFTALDYLLLFVPFLIGLISALWKAINGTLDFSTMAHIMTSTLLVILPLTYAVRAYLGFRQKKDRYNANLTRMLSLQSLATNSGAVTAILNEVSDQETMDVLLAYAFLWKGRRSPLLMSRTKLDREIEEFLSRQLRTHEVESMIRYDVRSACDKLYALKLLQKLEVTDGETWVQAVPSEKALEVLSAIDISKRQQSLDIRSQRTTTNEFSNLDVV